MPTDIDFTKVGQRIRSVRKKNNMTQEFLADACGCTRNHLSAIENGENRPSIDLLIRIAVILNSSIDYFLLDCPHTNPQYIINSQIAPKLEMCSTHDLQCINRMIDEMLRYRDEIIASEKEQERIYHYNYHSLS